MLGKIIRWIRAFLIRLLGGDWEPLICLLVKHEGCCGYAAKKVAGKIDMTSAGANRLLEQAYQVSERQGCTLSGFQRRLMTYAHVMKRIDFECGTDRTKETESA